MYKTNYLQATEIAEQIRSGEYAKRRKIETPDQQSSLMQRRPQEEEPEQELDYMEEVASIVASIRIQEEALLAERMKSVPPESSLRPRSYAEGGEKLPLSKQAEVLTSDPAFMENLKYLQQKHGVTDTEVFNIIKGESAFNPAARNADTDASGLFQFIPSTAADLGYTTEEIRSMEAAEQLMVYDQYLDKWGYSGEGLGIMQAAPAYRKADDHDIIYDTGSSAWKVNPGWRSGGDGPITKGSINDYYRGVRS